MKTASPSLSNRTDRDVLVQHGGDETLRHAQTDEVSQYFTLYLLQELLSTIGLRHKH